jgi:hypothetical protein
LSLSDFIDDSQEAEARRALLARGRDIKNRLMPLLLSSLSMTGAEFCIYMRIMGLEHGFMGRKEPTESDIVIFERKVDIISNIHS